MQVSSTAPVSDSYNVLGQRLTMTNELFISLLLVVFVAIDFLARQMNGGDE